MKIVVLDGYTLNPGDLSWDSLHALGDCTIHDNTPNDEVARVAADADVVLTNKVLVTRDALAHLPRLRFVSVLATGYNIVDVEACRERDIPVSNVPTYSTQSVAQMVFAHLLEFTQHVGHHAQTVREGRWAHSPAFSYWDYPLIELDGLTMGIFGFGRIGRQVAVLARAFGMQVLAYDAFVRTCDDDNVCFVDIDTLFAQSDVVTLHSPLTPDTKGLVNARLLGLMKPTAYLINTSRGPVVNEHDLYDALAAGKLAGAGLDVLEVEPPALDNPLYALDNCHITPHISWATQAARARLLKTTVENIQAFIAGKPQNVVN